jgi:adenylosuccinate synthase
MAVNCVVGMQWGDEGKGKIVDILAKQSDMVVRYQGGSNAGHTIVWGSKKFVFHTIPTGILYPHVRCLIANGVVVDPARLLKEISEVEKAGISIRGRLFISERAHIVMPYHRLLDSLSETLRGKNKIGTTNLGIGPCYSDKYARTGIRMIDLYESSIFKDKLNENLQVKNIILKQLLKQAPLKAAALYKEYMGYARQLKPYLADTRTMIMQAMAQKRNILFEGAQGILLDIDWGTYPFVTSSNAGLTGLAAGCGIPLRRVGEVLGVLKAYTTRVGAGYFPTELNNALGNRLRETGGEYGATTGRARRCGWLDLVSARYAAELNAVDGLSITKLDVLSGLKTIRVCVAYRYKGKLLNTFPASLEVLAHCQPVYNNFPGWNDDIITIRKYNRLPVNARKYLDFIRKTLKVKIAMVSVGQERSQIIYNGAI